MISAVTLLEDLSSAVFVLVSPRRSDGLNICQMLGAGTGKICRNYFKHLQIIFSQRCPQSRSLSMSCVIGPGTHSPVYNILLGNNKNCVLIFWRKHKSCPKLVCVAKAQISFLNSYKIRRQNSPASTGGSLNECIRVESQIKP